ncbi:hypothetical protein [Aureimonas ureilytica]|uniref:hypothetical protein n=1 Tax=Aureimonas ureilytica TaxID=401562 RepID=UPI000370EBBF|nr:hypothetical protein [Aureimonas ureilytica]
MSDYQPQKRGFFRLRGHSVELFGRTMRLPANRLARMGLGVALMIGGVFSFLPVLGLWMLPLGLVILSIDLAFVRRWRRRTEVKWGRRRRPRAVEGQAGQGRSWYRWVRLPSFGRR